MRYATRHLTDHFHLLCLLKGRLGLPTFSDLLTQLFIRLFNYPLNYLLYNHDVLSFFSLPNISLADKSNLIEIFLKKFQLPLEFKKLILLLIKHNRITLITDVLKYISYI